MDTSDSECFESADEDLNSDTENDKTKTPPDTQKDASPKLKVEELTIHENVENANKNNELPAPNTVTSDSSSQKDGRLKSKPSSNRNTEKAEKRAKPTKSKLGVKLGTKINNPSKCDSELENKTLKSNYGEMKDEYKSESNDEENHVSLLKDIKNETNMLKLDSKKEDVTLDNETNMWVDDDDWEPIANNDKQTERKDVKNDYQSNKSSSNDASSGWGSWGKWDNWDVGSLLTTATQSVTTITNHVSQGLTTVLESGIGVPDPEELARLHKMEKKEKVQEDERIVEKQDEDKIESKISRSGVPDLTFGLGSFVSGVSQITKLVETTGNKVISSGLDTLETIGKKTMEVLQEGDPGLKKKRAFLKIDSNKPVLSHILREAKEKAEEENRLAEERHVSRKANYETLFDDHQGLAHLEALEMLSRQCDIKLTTLLESHSGEELMEMQETLSQIKELCEIIDEDEDEKEELNESEIKEKVDTAVTELNVTISYSKLILTWKTIDEWLENLDLNVYNALQLHEESINVLAQFTAVAVELFHKTGELLLIKEHRSTVDEADSLVQLTTIMTTLISDIARKASNKLNEKASLSGNKDNINQYITNIFFEATNSSSYIKNAFELLIPVLQVGAV